MESLQSECQRALKKQRLSASKIDAQLSALLQEVESATVLLVAHQEQDNRRRKKPRANSNTETKQVANATPSHAASTATAAANDASGQQDMDGIVQDFVDRVCLLNVEKNVAEELKAIHVVLSKFGKHIDKTLCADIATVCHSKDLDKTLVCQLVAQYLYHDGRIDAADEFCKVGEGLVNKCKRHTWDVFCLTYVCYVCRKRVWNCQMGTVSVSLSCIGS